MAYVLLAVAALHGYRAGAQESDLVRDPERFTSLVSEWAQDARDVPDGIADQVKRVANGEDLLVVFVPGVLGSRLVDRERGTVLWGGDGMIEPRDLAFNGTTADAELLNVFPVRVRGATLSHYDVYGKVHEALLEVLGPGIALEVVGYDWRQDLEGAAGELDRKLRELKARHGDRRLLLIGHSMGGVVAWTWLKSRYLPAPQEHLELAKVWLAGSPVRGSCEVLRMLMEGYGPPLRAGFAQALGYKLLFERYRPATATFSSLYHLLPDPDEHKCLVVKTPGGLEEKDHFDVDVWVNWILPELRVASGSWLSRGRTIDVWDQLKQDKSAFMTRLQADLAAAREFRRNVVSNARALSGYVRFFYSTDHSTTSRLSIDTTANLVTSAQPAQGDGRVVGENAYLSMDDREAGVAVKVRGDHGGLLSDEDLLGFIRTTIRNVSREKRALRVARIVVNDPRVLEAYARERGVLVPLDRVGVLPSDRPSAGPARLARDLAALNLATLRVAGDRDGSGAIIESLSVTPEAFAIDTYLSAVRGELRLTREQEDVLYGSVLALVEPEGLPRLRLLSRYAASLAATGRTESARSVAVAARSLVSDLVADGVDPDVEAPDAVRREVQEIARQLRGVETRVSS